MISQLIYRSLWPVSHGFVYLLRFGSERADQTATLTGFPATINDTLITVAGTDVFFIGALGQKPPTKPAPATALLHLIARV